MATIPGSTGNDTLTGTSAGDAFVGSTGNDTITGGGGSDIIYYGGFGGFTGLSVPVSVSFGSTLYSGTTSKNTGGSSGLDTFSGIRGAVGTAGADFLAGTTADGSNAPFSITLTGGAGNDIIIGQKNSLNTASYLTATVGVRINFQTSTDSNGNWSGTALDGQGGTDTLINVTRANGSNFDDVIVGSQAQDQFGATVGNDTYDGSLGTNILRYDILTGTHTVGVIASAPTTLLGGASASIVKTAVVAGSSNSADTAFNVNQYRGTSGADTFVGVDGYSYYSVRMRGDAGNDTFDGRGNTSNRVEYVSSSSAVQVDLTAGTATDGFGGNDTLINVRSVQGSSFNDTLLGSAASDTFEVSDAGSHLINGRAGGNTVFVSGANAVTIDLGTTATADGGGGFQGSATKSGGTDTLLNIANAYGGSGNDTIRGTSASNFLSGDRGNNLIDGRGGNDYLDYRVFTTSGVGQTNGVTVNLGDGLNASVTNPFGGTDTLISIESIRGTQLADDLTGAILASGDFSFVRGEGGADVIRAPSAGTRVTADYFGSLSGVNVDLAQQKTSDDGWFGGTDTLVNIRSVRGSNFNDVIKGATTDDIITTGLGDDQINAGLGANVIDGGAGNDTIVFDFRLADATLVRGANGAVTISAAGVADTVSNVESFVFQDATVNTADGQPLVDDLYYAFRYKDVAIAGLDPDAHYSGFGANEGRDPNALFSTRGYLAANPDVAAAGLNPLDHYANFGWREGRDPSATFDNELYLARNPDVQALGINPLTHYLTAGITEGRVAYSTIGKAADLGTHPGFDAEFYLLSNVDVANAALASGGNTFTFAYNHFEAYGRFEGRNPNSVFDVKGYLGAYSDVANAGIDPLAHYHDYGWREGRDPSGGFDTDAYRAAYTDVAQAQIDPMLHYLQYGAVEGRQPFADGVIG